MSVFLFKILPLVALLVLIAGVVLISKGISNENHKIRFIGMGLIVLFVLLLVYIVLMALART
ncbi:hypothetical protein EDD70_2057 [Hydrogenoanaerobacterium saccharovorans]|uniref:Uncharacterized protein n=1 Tax=Hydrogenoanaerobacterium saccharovorans TaxID=474960 RepID=A0A1H8CGM3_9FIRM|nr:hypothetical protein [Hydrogenoanaerobacterium saccharovorans]RPF43099.1 hypothetical protein EDD70_2057 [Hydrogenoanaerobacterium saccharovorans]SEM94195.1 hypothetical protein SAMN05216180_2115 [Hydrogenoanaerobacterium saccharovorans]